MYLKLTKHELYHKCFHENFPCELLKIVRITLQIFCGRKEKSVTRTHQQNN